MVHCKGANTTARLPQVECFLRGTRAATSARRRGCQLLPRWVTLELVRVCTYELATLLGVEPALPLLFLPDAVLDLLVDWHAGRDLRVSGLAFWPRPPSFWSRAFVFQVLDQAFVLWQPARLHGVDQVAGSSMCVAVVYKPPILSFGASVRSLGSA